MAANIIKMIKHIPTTVTKTTIASTREPSSVLSNLFTRGAAGATRSSDVTKGALRVSIVSDSLRSC